MSDVPFFPSGFTSESNTITRERHRCRPFFLFFEGGGGLASFNCFRWMDLLMNLGKSVKSVDGSAALWMNLGEVITDITWIWQ